MPIGKNALKRVSNNGYSNVKTAAPDMENSTVSESTPEVKAPAKIKESSAKCAPKKNTTPKTKREPVKAPKVKKVEKDSRPDGFARYELGSQLPVHLL